MRKDAFVLSFFALLLVSCSANTGPTSDDFKALGLAYHNYCDSFRKGPATFAGLSQFLGKEFDASKINRIEFLYDVSIREMTAGTAKTVLAYEKNVPTEGGLVLFGDGTVRTLTAQEFEDAPKAKIIWTAGPEGQDYAHPNGRFECHVPAGWTVDEKSQASRSDVRIFSGEEEIRVIARPTEQHTLDDSDKAEMTQTLEKILEAVRTRGGNGRLVAVTPTTIHGAPALQAELEIDRPGYRWVRQVKFKQDGWDHTLGLYVGTQDKRDALATVFQQFLDSYRSLPAGTPDSSP